MTWRHIFFFLIIVLLSILLLRFSLQKLLAAYYDRSFGTGLILSQSGCPHTRLKPSCTTMVWGERFSTDGRGSRNNASRTSGKRKLWLGDSVTMGCGVCDSAHFVNLFAQGDSIYYHENPSVAGWSISDYRCFLAAYPEPDMLG